MTELPKLPESHYHLIDMPVYVEGDMRAYGAACIEAAIKAALSAPLKTSRQDQRWACAAAIRGML